MPVSWRQQMNYDPLGDGSRANRVPPYRAKKFEAAHSARVQGRPHQGEPVGPRTDSDLIVALGLRPVKAEERKRRQELIRKIYRTEET